MVHIHACQSLSIVFLGKILYSHCELLFNQAVVVIELIQPSKFFFFLSGRLATDCSSLVASDISLLSNLCICTYFVFILAFIYS